ITVLLLTQMLLALMSPLKRWVQMTLITALFIIGHTPVLASSDFFWNVDTVLVAVLYYSLGHYAKDFIVKYNHSFWAGGRVGTHCGIFRHYERKRLHGV